MSNMEPDRPPTDPGRWWTGVFALILAFVTVIPNWAGGGEGFGRGMSDLVCFAASVVAMRMLGAWRAVLLIPVAAIAVASATWNFFGDMTIENETSVLSYPSSMWAAWIQLAFLALAALSLPPRPRSASRQAS